MTATASAPEKTHLALLALAVARDAHNGPAADGRDLVEEFLRPVAESLTVFGPAAVATGWLRRTMLDLRDLDIAIAPVHTPQTLLAAGVPRYVVDAVAALARRGEATLRNPLARIVALAGNLHAEQDLMLSSETLSPEFHRAILTRRAVLLDGIDEDPRDIAAMAASLRANVTAAIA